MPFHFSRAMHFELGWGADPESPAATASLLESTKQLLAEGKATDIRIYDVSNKVVYANYVVLCNGSSSVHLNALASRVARLYKSRGVSLFASRTDEAESGWLVLDYGGIVIHIMSLNQRLFYGLDDMFSGPKREAPLQ